MIYDVRFGVWVREYCLAFSHLSLADGRWLTAEGFFFRIFDVSQGIKR
jgi:hypothetical protein